MLIGRFSQLGASSVKKIAIPNEMGTAINNAIPAVISVPKIGIIAPYCSCTGSQYVSNRKLPPKRLILSPASYD